jgi:ClpP class serine protease
MNAAAWILSHNWAILPSRLESFLAIANRESGLPDEVRSAIAARDADPLPNSRRSQLRDGVAIIPVVGPIFARANLLAAVCGGVSVATLAKDFQAALDDPAVSSIVLNIDSPGGEVTGVSELSDMIFNARGKKTITAYIYGLGTSAAYWIASAADRVVIAATGEAGSIGIVSAYTDTKARDEKNGVKTHEIVSSVSPKKRPDLATDAGRAQILATLDALADVFVGDVARNRGVTRDDVINKFGQGGVFVGKEAVTAGMADSVGSFEAVISENMVKNNNFRPLFAAERTATMDVKTLKEQHPAVYAAIFEEGKKAGAAEGNVAAATAERERIKAIQAIKFPGQTEFINAAAFNPEATVASVSVELVQREGAKIESVGKNHATDAASLGAALNTVKDSLPANPAGAAKPDGKDQEKVSDDIISKAATAANEMHRRA